MRLLLLLILASAVANAAEKEEQCLLIRDDYKLFEVLVPQNVPIRTKLGWQTHTIPKKILPSQFRQLQLSKLLNYTINFKLRKMDLETVTNVTIDASKYVTGTHTQENTYYAADILPQIFVTLENKSQIEIAGNKFAMGNGEFKLHIASCSALEIFSPAPELVEDETSGN